MTPRLQRPSTSVHASFLDAMAEFQAEGRGGPTDNSMIGSEIREFATVWHTAEGYSAYVARFTVDADPLAERPPGRVPCTTLWWVEADQYLARIAIRHVLNEFLREVAGHIGYDVRPSARRRGHASAMLKAALPVAFGLGIGPALITCDTDNVASRKTIEANGGVYEDERHGKLRYWVPTGAGG